jgi:hypothetical protein
MRQQFNQSLQNASLASERTDSSVHDVSVEKLLYDRALEMVSIFYKIKNRPFSFIHMNNFLFFYILFLGNGLSMTFGICFYHTLCVCLYVRMCEYICVFVTPYMGR